MLLTDLEYYEEYVLGMNRKKTILLYNVPMVDGDPWKTKAEQVIRFTDVEIGKGDQTAYDLLYYKQPCDRKIILILMHDKLVGLVVAEKVLTAYRLLKETVRYQELQTDPAPVRVGINRLWIHVSMRNRGLATILCNAIGRMFYKGEKLRKQDYAFNSNFGGGGIPFARRYIRPLRVPLYEGKTGINV